MIVKKNQVRSNLLDQTDENEDGTNNDEWAASRVANCSHQLAQSILRRYQVYKPFMLKEDLNIGILDNGKGFQFNGQWENFQFTVSTQLALGNQLQQHTRHQRG